IADMNATSMRDMGKVMAEVSHRLAGVDKSVLSGVVKKLLA
ncbi:MAG: GatB/YqeY domain-containing protein, partial [Fibrella sp.]|nr:GatB/YqeY domain-containing protein [Armatimonadota bacterium]